MEWEYQCDECEVIFGIQMFEGLGTDIVTCCPFCGSGSLTELNGELDYDGNDC